MMGGKRSNVTEEDSGKQLRNISNREKDNIVFSVKIKYKKDVSAIDNHQINPENENVPFKKKSIENVDQDNFLREIDECAEFRGQEIKECKAVTSTTSIYSSKAIKHVKNIDGDTNCNMNIINGGVKIIGNNDQTHNDKMNINFNEKCCTSNVHDKRSYNSSHAIECESNQNFEKQNALQMKSLKGDVGSTYVNPVEGNGQIIPKGVDFSLGPSSTCMYLDELEGMDEEVDEEINHVINSSEDDQMQFNNQVNVSCGLTVNTPATELNDTHLQIPSRTPLREKYYDDALMLMNCRCKSGSRYPKSGMMMPQCLHTTSDHQVPVVSLPSLVGCINNPPFSCNPNSHFYVTQYVQQKASILKAWKGYHGNVYFEPFTCKQLDKTSSFDICSNEYTKSADKSKSRRIQLPNLEKCTQSRVSFASDTKTERSATTKTEIRAFRSGKTKPSSLLISQSMRQMSILDRRSVMKRSNPRLREDVDWISSQESTGSLCIGHRPQQRTTSQAYNDSNKHYRLKIRRGIASQSFDFDGQPPVLSLNGGKFNEAGYNNKRIKYPSERKLISTDDMSEFYQYSSSRASIFDGSHNNRIWANTVHVVPSPNQGISRKLNIKDTSFRITFLQ